MTDPAAPALDYAGSAEDGHAARRLRQVAGLTAVCGPLVAVQWPAMFAGLYVWGRTINRSSAGPMSWADFDRIFPHLSDLLPAGVFCAVCGTAMVASAVAIGRRRFRGFSIVLGLLVCLAFPFGTVAGLPTALVLMRNASALAYDAARLRRTPP